VNKTEEAENYYRIHHVYPSWYVPHHYGYGWYDNGTEDANKTEEAENYYRLHGYYPAWYTRHTVVHHYDNEAEDNYYLTSRHHYGGRYHPYPYGY
jgi:hypothetical protein